MWNGNTGFNSAFGIGYKESLDKWRSSGSFLWYWKGLWYVKEGLLIQLEQIGIGYIIGLNNRKKYKSEERRVYIRKRFDWEWDPIVS